MSKAATKALIDANITENGTQAITGPILNNVLNTMVDDYGTQEEVSQLDLKVNGKTERNYCEGYKVLQDGTLEEDATSVVCVKVPVSYQDTITFNKAYSYICAYDANDVKLDHWSARHSVALTSSLVQTVSYILASFLKTNLSSAYIKNGTTTLWMAEETDIPGLDDRVTDLENELPNIEESISDVAGTANAIDAKIEGSQNYTNDFKVNQDGTLSADATSIVSDKITASADDVFTFNKAYSYICAYDANDVKLDHWSARASVTIGSSLTTVAYIRLSVLKTNISTAYAKRNGTTVWIPTRIDGIRDNIEGIDSILDKMDKDIFNYSIVGVGQRYAGSKASLDIKQNHNYRLVPITKTWTVDPATIGPACFWLNLGGTEMFTVIRDLQTGVVTLDDYYDFSVTNQSYATIYIRANVGDTIYFKLLDFSETLPEGNLERIISDEERITALEEGGDILRLHPFNTTAPKLANLNEILSVDLNHPFGTIRNFVALFFSDLHSTSRELGRIMKFYNAYSSYFTEIMQGGDLLHSFLDDTQFITDNGAEAVVGVMGNHEQFNTGQYVNGVEITSWNKNSQKMNYDKLIAPFLTDTGITVQEDHTYWYKDYADQKIRLIGIDNYHWREHVVMDGGAIGYEYADGTMCDNGEQASWFETTLAGAKTAGYSVIVLGHAPSIFDLIDSPFTTLDYINDIGGNQREAVDIVQDFIDGGGKFVCWLHGHIHQDAIGHIKDRPEQFQINIDTCRYGTIFGTLVAWGENKKILNTMSEDVFDVISVDSNRQYLTVMRFGCDSDRWGRKLSTFVYDWGNHQVLYNPK